MVALVLPDAAGGTECVARGCEVLAGDRGAGEGCAGASRGREGLSGEEEETESRARARACRDW